MNITRQNYEAYFLMYVDNELTAAECAAVDQFVQQNPDLAPELAHLQETILLPDDGLTFTNKAALYQSVEGVQLNNYEDYFLLYVDNELSPEIRTLVETFVLQHPELQDEFTLLQQTRLAPEVLAFGDKQSLYRSTDRRVIPISWLRMSIAAALVGLIALVYGVMPDVNVEQSNKHVAVEPALPEVPRTLPKLAEKKTAEELAATSLPTTTNEPAALKPALVKVKPTNIELNGRIANTKTVKRSITKTPQVQPAPLFTNTDALAKTIVPKVRPEDNLPSLTNRNNVPANTAVAESAYTTFARAVPTTEPVYKQAVYRELDVDQEEVENSILIGSAQINKNKLRGLLKKASGLFDKKGDRPDTDKKIKIAMFELR